MMIRLAFPERVALASSAMLWAAPARAHDMGNALVAYVVLLALPVPAVLRVVGWKWALMALPLLWVLALYLASLNYFLFYGVLLAPYVVWAITALRSRRLKGATNEV
ncbi:hypothetical protein FN976_05510 [Caenimonas sedimenti]|uniref:Uncharacterized protein n=1 Tax=Caenimonas sedimenti TaxID=2596921 RepID=A0A562ZUW4_9BURK|nr:hypothetical protein [Caenimonas sedimenti]TWO72171.1 hypothetical protein FN976_05510 [Caenimonas sedimenti]